MNLRGSGSKLIFLVGTVAIAAAAVILIARPWRSSGNGDTAYNVLLVTLDTTRADRLGCYGYEKSTSPNLDALAADAVRFDMAISTSAVTPIAHASILTGLNPDRHGLRVFYGKAGHFLSEAHPTLASVLKSRGWQTGAFISAYPASERFGLHWGFDTFETEVAESVMTQDPALRPPKDGYWLRRRSASAQRRADATADRALSWLDDVPRPFFLWAHFFDPHDASLVPPKEITDRFNVSKNDPDALRVVYDAEIFFMDRQLGRLLDFLKERGEYDRTVIVVLADHGQGLGDHGWFPHRLLYQEQIRLPMIARVPEGPRGGVVSDVVRNIDVLPTVLEVLGLEPPRPIQGLSLVSLMAGRPEPARLAYAEALNTYDVHAPRQLPPRHQDLLFCLVERNWKLIYHHDAPENTELYDLAADPRELDNVALTETERRARLLAALERSGAMQISLEEPAEPMSPEAIEKLRSLGYVGGQD